jgi:ATP-dependent helicase YprA (DUF1998 family)
VELSLGRSLTNHEAESTLAALVAATTKLGIARGDMDGVIRWSSGLPSLVLYDTVPGGAGHAVHLKDRVSELIDAAATLVCNCECGESSSCYGCLRSYENQYAHDQLSRAEAIAVLTKI